MVEIFNFLIKYINSVTAFGYIVTCIKGKLVSQFPIICALLWDFIGIHMWIVN